MDQDPPSRSAVPGAQWDPTQYARFSDHRSRPFGDLLARVGAVSPRQVVDLGCGDGAMTATLAQRWPTAQVLGVDNSPQMLRRAAAVAGGRVRFTAGDLHRYLPDPATDVVVSNAAYQWVDGHDEVLGRIARQLPAGGWLAVQVPGNFTAPSHTAIRELVAEPRWQRATGGLRLRTDPVLTPDGYADLLDGAGLVPDVWETSYLQVLNGADPVLEWVKGTALRPVLAALQAPDTAAFLADLAARLRRAYPPRTYGTVLPFRRIFAVGHRPD